SRTVYGKFSKRLRIRHGIAIPRSHRAGVDAAAPSVFWYAINDLDTQPAVCEPVFRYPLRDARNNARRIAEHGTSISILGIRLGNGFEIGPNEPANYRSARAFSEGSGGTYQPSHTFGMVFTLGCRLE